MCATLVCAPRLSYARGAAEVEPSGDVKRDLAPRSTGPIQQLRYLEDYGHLASPAAPRDALSSVKYVPLLWRDAYVSFGGQHRLRYEYTAPAELGRPGAEARESVMFSRNLLHADAHLHRHFRVFAQAGAYFALGAPGRDRPPGANLLDVSQLFVETRARASGVDVVTRVGRQEMGLGSTRWVSIRDGTNMRQAFDMGRISLSGATWSSHTFFGLVPKVQRGVLDDTPDPGSGFWGSYWTLPLAPERALSVDVFYLGRARAAAYGAVSGREVRHTFGARVFGELPSGLEYIAHGLVQVGTIAQADVLAWGVAGALWQRLPGMSKVARVGVRGDALSGDRAPGDAKVSTFDPLFPNQTFFSALPAFFPTNLYDLHPLVRLTAGDVRAEAGVALFWRQSVNDAVYRPPGPVLAPAAASDARFTAAQPTVSLGYRATRNLTFDAEYARVIAGPGLRDAGRRDIDFLGTWTTFTY